MAIFVRYTKLFLFSLTGLLCLTILILWPFKYVKPSVAVDKALVYVFISDCVCGILTVLCFLIFKTDSEVRYQLVRTDHEPEFEFDEGKERRPIKSPEFYGNIEMARIAFSSLKVFSSVKSFKSSDEVKDECAICAEEFKVGELILPFPCEHKFHASCINSWSGNITCPACRLSFKDLSETQR